MTAYTDCDDPQHIPCFPGKRDYTIQVVNSDSLVALDDASIIAYEGERAIQATTITVTDGQCVQQLRTISRRTSSTEARLMMHHPFRALMAADCAMRSLKFGEGLLEASPFDSAGGIRFGSI